MNLDLRLERPLVLFDLEGTGPDPKADRIIQIAMKIYYPSAEPEIHHTYINPTVPIPKVRFFLEHGYTDELIERGCARCGKTAEEHPFGECLMWRRIPRFEEVAKPVFNKLQDVDYAGYNIKRYDLPLLREEFARLKMEFDYSKANVICGLRLWQIIEPRTLSDAVEKWGGRKLEDAHDAMADVLGTELALSGMLRQPNVPKNINELGELLYPRDPDRIDEAGKFRFINGVASFTFGKYKGKPMTTDLNYLRWMIKDGDFNSEVKKIAQAVVDGHLPIYQPVSGSIAESDEVLDLPAIPNGRVVS